MSTKSLDIVLLEQNKVVKFKFKFPFNANTHATGLQSERADKLVNC